MADLTETSQWVPVIQIETTDVVQGGPGGKANEQAQDLADRTLYLKDEIESNDTEIAANAAAIAAETVARGLDIAALQAQITANAAAIAAIQPFNEVIYSSAGAGVGQHNLSSGKTFSTYDILVVTVTWSNADKTNAFTVDEFAEGDTKVIGFDANGNPKVEFNYVDDDTFEVTDQNSGAVITKIEGLKN